MSTFGSHFRVTTYGESHGTAVGCVVDGCPPGLRLDVARDIQPFLDRRRPGTLEYTSPRKELDVAEIRSGVEKGITLGTPIEICVKNHDHKPDDYHSHNLSDIPRPSHADLTYLLKYGIKASSGGGRSSARETIGRVAAGAIAAKYLSLAFDTEIFAFVCNIGGAEIPDSEMNQLLNRAEIKIEDANFRCPCPITAERIRNVLKDTVSERDSVGGVVFCMIRNAPQGLGEPCFDKLPAVLAHAMMSLPAARGFEIGAGFRAAAMRGSKHNDPYTAVCQPPSSLPLSHIKAVSNNAAGCVGGISDGREIYFRVCFKPPASIGRPQPTCTYSGNAVMLEVAGRHDPCVVTRAVPIVEAMAAIVIMDLYMAQASRQAASMALDRSSIIEARRRRDGM